MVPAGTRCERKVLTEGITTTPKNHVSSSANIIQPPVASP
jgi:hypothetical protein